MRKLRAASSLGDDHRRATITRSSFQEPDCYDHFSQSLRNTDLCRPSLGEDFNLEVVASEMASTSA